MKKRGIRDDLGEGSPKTGIVSGFAENSFNGL